MIIISTQTFPPDRGGMEALMGGLADAIHASGRKVMVFADRVHTTDVVGGEKPYPVLRFGGPRPLRRRMKVWAIARAARAETVEAVFTDSWKSAELLKLAGVPMAVLVHGTELPLDPSASKRARIARTFQRASAIVPNSNYSAGIVRDYVGDARIHVVHPPIAPQIEPSADAIARARTIAAAPGPVLLTVSRLEERKGVDNVIRAMPEILRRHPGAVYLVAGGGDDLARLQQLAAQMGVAERVRFLGPVDGEPKAALFAIADVFAMPARRVGNSVESFGIVYIEAGWYGVPSIAGRDGGAGDAVGDGVTGLLCDSFDAGDVAQKILQILDDPDLRRRLGQAAAQRARGPAQWAESLPRYLAAAGLAASTSR
jgi:phosphatidyl-myo-inositol dimannoside synthase